MSHWMTVLLAERTAIVLDWAGSVIMTGAIWGWVYERMKVRLHLDAAVAQRSQTFGRLADSIVVIAKAWEDKKRAKGRSSITSRLRSLLFQAKLRFASLWISANNLYFRNLVTLTESVFIGRTGTFLFITGFLMWNAAKLIAYLHAPSW